MKELHKIYINNINEFIRHGEYDPSDRALSLVWQELSRKFGAADVLSEAINGDELLSQDILNWIIFRDSGDQGNRRMSDALCDYARYFVDQDKSFIWEIWEEQGKPDPMDLAKENSYLDDIAGGLKGVF